MLLEKLKIVYLSENNVLKKIEYAEYDGDSYFFSFV